MVDREEHKSMNIGVERRYTLVTAAYNEEAHIENVLDSVVKQSVLPLRWVIVSDGSTDRTDAIVSRYASGHPFIRLLSLKKEHKRNFGAQVNAIRAGCAELQSLQYKYIGNLDADVSFESTYFAELLDRFERDPQLGLAGGFICEEQNGTFRSRRGNSIDSVAHAVQLFRRECFESIGGYLPLKYGGPDWHAGVTARMKGWKVRSFEDLFVRHHRPTGTADTWRRERFREGRMDYSVGSHPLFEVIKCIRRIPDKPWLLGALTRLAGFVWSCCVRESRAVSDQFVTFLRNEQMSRVRALSRSQSANSANMRSIV
jgi:biofilm PGA synthesis N-glycosyltransferase PgaC